MIAHCLRYHQKKKELKEQQDRVRILRKKWRGNSTFSHRSTEPIPWCKWWCSATSAQHNPETCLGFCLRPKWLGESDEYENADKECSSLGQLPPCKLPQLVQMALLCHGPRILEIVQVFHTCRHSHGTHFDSFDM